MTNIVTLLAEIEFRMTNIVTLLAEIEFRMTSIVTLLAKIEFQTKNGERRLMDMSQNMLVENLIMVITGTTVTVANKNKLRTKEGKIEDLRIHTNGQLMIPDVMITRDMITIRISMSRMLKITLTANASQNPTNQRLTHVKNLEDRTQKRPIRNQTVPRLLSKARINCYSRI
jgi:hypothetical protein